MGFASEPYLEAIGKLLEKDPDVGKKANGVFQFVLTKGPGGASAEWVVDTKAGKVASGKADKADVTMTISDDDFVAMVQGKLTGQKAWMSGKLKLAGNMMLAQKFGAITSKLNEGGKAKL